MFVLGTVPEDDGTWWVAVDNFDRFVDTDGVGMGEYSITANGPSTPWPRTTDPSLYRTQSAPASLQSEPTRRPSLLS